MKALKVSAMAILMLSMPAVVQAGGKSGGMRMPGMGGMHMPKPGMGGMHMPKPGGMHMPRPGGHVGMPSRNWGGKHQGRWVGGSRAPGGWGAYRRPYIGYALPSYWVSPSYYIGNYSSYGFAQPSYGYGWSRYYDDAVMTDRYGRVQDYVQGVNWDGYDSTGDYNNGGYENGTYGAGYGYQGQGGYQNQGGYQSQGGYQGYGYEDGYSRPKDRDGGLGGALIGGAVGAVTGGVLAKRRDNTEGALIGGVVGAVAGAAIDSSDRAGRGYKTRKRYSKNKGGYDNGYGYGYGAPAPSAPMGYDYGSGNGNNGADGVTYNGRWNGTWTGSYDGGPQQRYTGSYEGGYGGQNPHWGGAPGAGPAPRIHHGQTYGMGQHGMGYPGGYETTTVTVNTQPVVTTTTEIIEETVYVSNPVVRKRYAPKRVAVRAKPKPRCVCKVVYR